MGYFFSFLCEYSVYSLVVVKLLYENTCDMMDSRDRFTIKVSLRAENWHNYTIKSKTIFNLKSGHKFHKHSQPVDLNHSQTRRLLRLRSQNKMTSQEGGLNFPRVLSKWCLQARPNSYILATFLSYFITISLYIVTKIEDKNLAG